MRTLSVRQTSGIKLVSFNDKATFFLMSRLGSGRPQGPKWSGKDQGPPSFLLATGGGWETAEAALPHPSPTHRPRTAAGSGDLRSPAGASTAAGARGKPSGRGPRPPAAPRAAPARAPPAPGTRGMRANGGAGARPGPRAPFPPPRRMAAKSGQRRFLAPAQTVRWAFESGPGTDLSRCPTSSFCPPALPRPSTFASPPCAGLPSPPAPIHHPHPAKPPRSFSSLKAMIPAPVTLGDSSPRRMRMGEHLRRNRRSAPVSFAPSLWRRPLLRDVREQRPLSLTNLLQPCPPSGQAPAA